MVNPKTKPRVDSHTGLCCLIGYPIGHSVSPQMHNAAFQTLNLNLIYLAFQVERESLEAAVKGLRSLGVKGFNVTVPHKVSIIDYLDRLDDSALKVGAVNTVLNRDGELIGYNTDGRGFIKSVGIENLKGKYVAVLGTGGAARAIIYESAQYASRIFILNRTLSKAESLAREVMDRYPEIEIEAMPLTPKSIKKALERSSLLANATPIGMHPNEDEIPIPPSLLRRDLTVFDAVYNPLKTRLLKEAERLGAKTIGGLDMLVHQGGEAFKIWTGVDPPIQAMKEVALEALNEMKKREDYLAK